jgi:tetratricopeptide (TPR) repeat protein
LNSRGRAAGANVLRLILQSFAAVPMGAALAAGTGAAPAASHAEPTGVAREYSIAERAFQAGNLTEAEVLFTKIIEAHGDEPNAWLRIGIIQQRRHSFKAALSAYDNALSCAPPAGGNAATVAAKAHFNRALLLLEAAAQDLRGIGPGVLADSLDFTRETLAAHVDAALQSAGSAGPPDAPEPPASAAAGSSALGYVYVVKTPVVTVGPLEDVSP